MKPLLIAAIVCATVGIAALGQQNPPGRGVATELGRVIRTSSSNQQSEIRNQKSEIALSDMQLLCANPAHRPPHTVL